MEDLEPGTPEAWAHHTSDKTPQRPYCYNRADFLPTSNSVHEWIPGCSAWLPGGNAHVLPYFIDHKGVKIKWTGCSGCQQRKL